MAGDARTVWELISRCPVQGRQRQEPVSQVLPSPAVTPRVEIWNGCPWVRWEISLVFPQVRNLCYMVTRRERTKHAICKLQEQIFHLQMKLIEQDLCRGRRPLCLPPATSVCTQVQGWIPRRVFGRMCVKPGASAPLFLSQLLGPDRSLPRPSL